LTKINGPGRAVAAAARCVALCGIAACLALANPLAASAEEPSKDCSYYAAPTKVDGGEIPPDGAWARHFNRKNSFGEPGTVGGFWLVARPGEMLCLRSGTYRGKSSMLVPPPGFGGAPGKPIRVVALDDGDVWFDGERRNATAAITGPHWVVSGFNAYDSKSGVFAVDGRTTPAHDIIARRIVVWRNPGEAYENSMNVDISFASDVLLEDVGCFGHARKCVQIHRSLRVTARRVWARWDGRWPYLAGNEFSISPMYRSFDSLAENVLATSGGDDETGFTPATYRQTYTLIGTDATPTPEDVARWAPGRDGHDVRVRVLGSIAYAGPDQRHLSAGLLMTRAGVKGSLLKDVAISIPASSDRVIMNHHCLAYESDCVWKPGDKRNTATQLTLMGGPLNLRTKWKLGDFAQSKIEKYEVQQPVDVFTPGPDGASVCHRYVDGKLTNEPLWPWPMDARILAATRKSQWGEANVTADVEAIFGKIPPQCRTDR
jgi:hypothetical protein